MNNKILSQQTFKKELPPKGAYYGNFELQSRRDVVNDQFAMTPPGPNTQLTAPSPSSNSSAIHNSYGTPQALLKSSPATAKSRFGNANISDGYYGAGGYFGGKHPNASAEYYGKYEAEFIAHQQKISNQVPPFGNQPSKNDFHEGKANTDFPQSAIKGEMHHGLKHIPTPAAQQSHQQLHSKNIDYHYGKTASPHLGPQNFYNHGPHTANHDSNHQNPMQYNSNQYFGNEFGNANDMDYYEQKTAAAAQGAYFDMYNNSNNNGNEFSSSVENTYATPSNGQLPNEHCEHFGYPQYYDGNHHQHHPHPHPHPHPQSHSNNTAIPAMQTPQVHQPSHIGHGPNPLNANQPQFHHGIANAQSYHTAHQINGTGTHHLPNSQMDNSNSSSEFNFLSNLANDFAPEYYQLS